MDDTSQIEREARAARNQAMFRALNEKMAELNEAWQEISDGFVIACECADTACVEMVRISRSDYETIRSEPNRFAVLAGHVYPDVEAVVAEQDGHVVVEKFAPVPLLEESDPRR